MKTRNAILAVLFLIALGASSCALLKPAVEEQEEETTMEKKSNEKGAPEYCGPWMENPCPGD